MSDFEIKAQLKAEQTLHEILRITTAFNRTEDAVGKVSRQAAKAEREIQRAAAAVQAMNKAENAAKATPIQAFIAERNRLDSMKGHLPDADYKQAIGKAWATYQDSVTKPQREALKAMQAEADAANAAMGRLAAGIRKANETPFDKLKQGMQAAAAAKDSGSLTRGEYRAEKRRLADVFKATDPGSVKAADDLRKIAAEAEKADASLNKMAADMRKVNTTPFEKYINGLRTANNLLSKGKIGIEDYNREVKKLSGELEGAGSEGQKAFGASAVQGLMSYASGMLTVSTAVNVARAAYQHLQEVQEKGLAVRKDMGAVYTNLAAVSKKGEIANDRELGWKLAEKYKVDPKQAFMALTEARSSDFTDKEITDLFETNRTIENLETSSKVMGLVKTAFPDITPRQGYNTVGTVAAAARFNPEDYAKFVPNAAASGKAAGATFGNVNAIVAGLADDAKGVESAADQAKELFIHMNQSEFIKELPLSFSEKIQLLSANNESQLPKSNKIKLTMGHADAAREEFKNAQLANIALVKLRDEDRKPRFAKMQTAADEGAKATGTNDDFMTYKARELDKVKGEKEYRQSVGVEVSGQRTLEQTYIGATASYKAALGKLDEMFTAAGWDHPTMYPRRVTRRASVEYAPGNELAIDYAETIGKGLVKEAKVGSKDAFSDGGFEVTAIEQDRINTLEKKLSELQETRRIFLDENNPGKLKAEAGVRNKDAELMQLNKLGDKLDRIIENTGGGSQRDNHTGTIGGKRDKIEKASIREE